MLMTKNGVTIREIIASDRAGWEHLWQQYLHFYRADVSAEITKKTFIRLCQKQDLVGLVAVNDQGQLLGFMHLVYHASTWSDKNYCYIEDLFVDKSARGKNVAESLFNEAYQQAEVRESSRVYWMTQEFNSSARSLYDKIGQRTSFIIYSKK
ncbi:GNAT family N-acetyltransferase [Serratia sp. JSRIV001]|uniref:GNAT family N-acetyltransferase n=1 Tax=Serratia sp. JSRIV001 TaxID=2831893 RepID=UPI001CC043A0|nr:GNAT family N-acetyltransferase [Serratia sp. JSRIV001]UAN45852.1 GNAT family N-acetyltransferase [Serratia sp. JSRIV001]